MGIDQSGESNNGNSNSNIDLRTSLQPPPSTSPPATATNRNNHQPRVITSSHFNCSPPFLLPICADRWFRTVQNMGSATSSTISTPPGRRSDHHQPPPKKIHHHQTNAECQPPSCFVLTMHRYQINTEDDPPSCFLFELHRRTYEHRRWAPLSPFFLTCVLRFISSANEIQQDPTNQ
jgi:hypothetical protein